jgi:hypothetical protein
VLALLASQRDLRPDIGGSHDGVPFYCTKVWTIQVTGQLGSPDPNSNTLTSTPDSHPPASQAKPRHHSPPTAARTGGLGSPPRRKGYKAMGKVAEGH